MTREEAIKKLQKQKAEYLDEWVDYSGVAEAYDMAIEALQAEYEDYEHATLVDIKEPLKVSVVRCKDCRWYDCPHIEHNDGTRTDYPTESVTIDVGINCGGTCVNPFPKTYCLNHERENPDDLERLVIYRNPTDFCSLGERKEE